MDISLLKESYPEETRVLLNPAGVGALVAAGHRVYVQTGAGDHAGWSDAEYLAKGATITYSMAEAISRSELVAKVLPPSKEEIELLEPDQLLFSFLLITAMPKAAVAQLSERRITAIAMESMMLQNGSHPVREAMSEIGGRLAVQFAGTHLQTNHGGRGILLPSLPGVPGAQVAILGAGAAGIAAARAAVGAGARVLLLERYPERLRALPDTLFVHLETMAAIPDNISRVCQFVDALISTVHMEDSPAPHVVSAEMVKTMKPGSVLVDLSIDQGGSAETSRPTSLRNPVYVKENVTHICVPNLPSAVGRTASHVLTNIITDEILQIADFGLQDMLTKSSMIRNGLSIWQGKATRQTIAEFTGLEAIDFPMN
ncbi:MAG: alanine dehydrogenase [bacterium]|nr:alanine dehydrogenase [bacterium]